MEWQGTGVGFGIRGSPSPNITRQFTGEQHPFFPPALTREKLNSGHRHHPAVQGGGAPLPDPVQLLARHLPLGHPAVLPPPDELHRQPGQGPRRCLRGFPAEMSVLLTRFPRVSRFAAALATLLSRSDVKVRMPRVAKRVCGERGRVAEEASRPRVGREWTCWG